MRRIPRNTAGIGCKGGTSATAGRRRVTYTFTLPDGREQTAHTFKVTAPEAVAHLSQFRGEWCFDGIRPVGAPAPFAPPGTVTVAVPARLSR